MQRLRPFLTAAVLLIGATATTASAQELQEDVQKLADRWSEAYNSHNRAALGRLYTANAHLMMHGSPTIAGREKIEDFWADDFLAGNPLTVLNVTHSLEGADMILVHGNYEVIDRDTGVVLGRGRFAHIWNKGEGDTWLLDRDLWNEPFEPYRR
jgi:ketosteroid isomerase-like protein